jgi:hypothetical protein
MAIKIRKTADVKKRDLVAMLKAAGQDVRGASVLVEVLPGKAAVPTSVSASLEDADVIVSVTWTETEDV